MTEQKSWLLARIKNLRSLLSKPIGYRTVFAILIVTALETTLFWRSQMPVVMDYSNGLQALAEFKYFDEKLDRQLESVRSFRTPDPVMVLSSVALLRDLGNNLDGFFSEMAAQGDFSPDSLAKEFDRHLILRMVRTQQLVRDRAVLRDEIDSVRILLLDSLSKGKEQVMPALNALWAVRSGEIVDPNPALPQILFLLKENQRQMALIRSLHDASTQLVVDDLITQYRVQLHSVLHIKEQLSEAFYILSILTLLAVVALLVRIPR